MDFKEASIQEGTGFSVGHLPYTSEYFIKQAFKLLGTYYEWGDKGAGRDCSSTLAGIYKTFGINLPRNTDQQEISAGKSTTLKGLSEKERYNLLNNCNVGDALFMNGHVAMYLGNFDGKHYIIHNFSGITVEEDGSSRYIPILRTAVTPADMKSSSGKSYINSYTSILQFK